VKVVVARSLDEALAALADASTDARILAGGTDLVVEMESGRTRPDLVVDVGRVADLRWIRATDSALEIGAGATCTDLLRSDLAAQHADLLVEAAREVGAVQIQNRATIGGNLGTASPAADLTPVLFALGARVRLRSRDAARELAVEDFVTGYRTTRRRPDELIESIAVPLRRAGEQRAFRKVGTRRAQSISKVVLALAIGPSRIDARIAVGSVAECTLRLRTLESAIAAGITPTRLDRAIAESLTVDIRPRDDVRSSADYRRDVLARLLARVLHDPLKSLRP
jgi:CO/xanthine dehydrogenase FAD-binding subunit